MLSSFILQSGTSRYLINKRYPGGKGLEDETLQYTYFREMLNSLVLSVASNQAIYGFKSDLSFPHTLCTTVDDDYIPM